MTEKSHSKIWMVAGASALALSLAALATAEKKEKPILPEFVLNAESVAVVIAPEAGEPVSDPAANRVAQQDVEVALLNWGRFRLIQGTFAADLVIAVRKGTKGPVNATINGGGVDSRPVTVDRSDDGIHIGARSGTDPGDPKTDTSQRPAIGMEAGSIAEDQFEVYRGGNDFATGPSAPIWRYAAKDALKYPGVPAVAEFRKAIEQSLKAIEKNKKQTQQKGQQGQTQGQGRGQQGQQQGAPPQEEQKKDQ